MRETEQVQSVSRWSPKGCGIQEARDSVPESHHPRCQRLLSSNLEATGDHGKISVSGRTGSKDCLVKFGRKWKTGGGKGNVES